MRLSVLSHFCLLLVANKAKPLYKCNVAEALKAEGMDRYGGYSLGDWLCVIHYTSGFDPEYEDDGFAGQNHYGIFQIDSHNWCYEDCVSSKKKCNVPCSNLKDDIACAKKIVSSYDDIDYW
uniref:Lysozyme n=1 Tax=Anolis carolinensis TaxID=28377 RepID=A0A803SML6_ANOCA